MLRSSGSPLGLLRIPGHRGIVSAQHGTQNQGGHLEMQNTHYTHIIVYSIFLVHVYRTLVFVSVSSEKAPSILQSTLCLWEATFPQTLAGVPFGHSQLVDLYSTHVFDCSYFGISEFAAAQERPRPEFTAMAPMTMRNPVTGTEEPYFPENKRLNRTLTGCMAIVIMVSFTRSDDDTRRDSCASQQDQRGTTRTNREGRLLVVNSEFWGQSWHLWRLYLRWRKNYEMKTKAGVSCDRASEIVHRQNKTDFHAGCGTKLNILCADFCGADVSHRHHSVSHHSANCVLQVEQQLRQFLCE